jgi:hypothetical protein
MNLQLEFSPNTAVRIAEYFEKSGLPTEAERLWLAIKDVVAYDCNLRAQLGEIIFDSRERDFELGTVFRSRLILDLMAIGYPTPKLVGAYFENLRRLLQSRMKLEQPGSVILSLGTGRCGSTTLAAAFASVPNVCATHENPPHIFWKPFEEQVRFHFERLRMLADYFPVVFDAAHWWLNVCPRFLTEFPNSKVIGLVRDTDTCVNSFLKFQGRGLGSMNHWAPPDNGVWKMAHWDPTFPAYAIPAGIRPGTDGAWNAKKLMVARYVTEYNQSLSALEGAYAQRVMLIRTESLNEQITAARLRSFVGLDVTMPARSLNVGNNNEGAQPECWY